jgi:DNA-directed RNA polymerase subunit A'
MQAELFENIRFTAISPEMIRKMSVAKIVVADTCNDEGYPIDGALLDQRLGVIDPGLKCKTCGGKIKTCPGHFGHIELVRPVVHPEFAKTIYLLLDATCDSCHRILLNQKQIDAMKPEIEDFVRSVEDTAKLSSMQHDKGTALIKKLKGVKRCPYCEAEQRKIKFERPTSFYVEGSKLKPDDTRDWLSKISDEDLALLGIDGSVTRPEWFIITDLLVAPVNIRPSITLESGERSEDDLTHKLLDVIRTNQRLEQDIDAGAPQIIIDDLWELLQYQVTIYFNNETPGVPVARQRNTRPLKTLAQRLKGKEGRLRYNLSGKRVNFSARTVITPDNNISLNEVGVPQKIAENLTVPVYVTKWNIEYAKKYLKNTSYPLVLNHITKNNVRKRVTTEVNREELVAALQPGDILERQLIDGDIVLFNRQPTLHRASIMAHYVKVLPGRTFRMHLNVTIPYNADFDGDEMNMHVPQSLEAQAEARHLMTAERLMLSARDGLPLMFAEEDIISGIYMLTKEGAEFPKDEAARMLASVGIYELPKPKENQMYSGSSIFSMLLPDSLNIEAKRGSNKVIIKDGELKEGHIGSGMIDEDGALILEIFGRYGKDEARKFLDNATKLAVRAVYIAGLTISLKDYYAPEMLTKERDKVINQSEARAAALLTKYKEKALNPLPGYTRKQTYEMETFATLDISREIISKVLRTHLSPDNNAMLMVAIKSRGSMLNLVQTSMFLGQQAVRGGRPSRGYSKRVLPYFHNNDKSPEAKGFIKSNFLNGLSPIDYYMHAMGARDSGIGKPLVTADSGYLQRRLINALQDFYVERDLSVRDASGSVIQTIDGGDGIDPMKEVLVKKRND